MDPMAKFIGIKVPAGESVGINAEIDDDVAVTYHFTQIALGDKPGKGSHTVFIESEDGKFAVGTLDKDSCRHFSVDITIAGDAIALSHTGPSPVHFTGYATQEPLGYYSDDDDELAGYRGAYDSEEDTDMEGDTDLDSDEEEAPVAVPLSGGKAAQARAHVDDEADEDSSEEEDDSEDGSEEEASEEEEEEEEEPAPAKKRKGGAAAAQTPQPAKKAKGEAPKAPATAPAKMAAGGATPASEAEYAAALKAFLQKSGPKRLAELGSAVKRPPKSPKMKKFLEAHAGTFKFNETTQTVSLA